MRNIATRLCVSALLACVIITHDLVAQRVIRETKSEWNRAKQLTIARAAMWCAAADVAGCDFKSIDNATLLPGGGVVVNSRTGPIRQFDAKGKFLGALGRKGSGSGEYGLLIMPQVVKDRVV